MRRIVLVLALGAMAPLAACGGGDDASKGDGSTDDEAATVTTEDPRDQSPFCVAIRALEAMGSDDAAVAGTPAEVLAQNAQLTELIDEADANAPADAPADVQSLIDDYAAFADAIDAAAGDRDAAIATLTTDDPELLARFAQADAHGEAFTFFAQRCATAPPP